MFQLVLAIVFGCIVGSMLIRWYLNTKNKISLKRISRRAQIGETEAALLLQSNGYSILDEQVRMPVQMLINNEIYESYVKADYIVEKSNKRYVVEVKTGKQANIHLPNVRRQLFEYQNIFQPDGILFVDMNNYDIMNVTFNDSARRQSSYGIFGGGVLTGVCLILIVLSYL